MLRIEKLTVDYEGIRAVQQADVIFEPGRITGLIGPNGAGKSSLLKACVGLIADYSGSIFYADKNLQQHRFWVKQHCSFAPEDAELMPYLTGDEFLRLIGQIRNVSDLKGAMQFLLNLLGLAEKKDELILNYSHGMRQKIALATALIGKPDYIILDEALNGLDSIALIKLKGYLRKLAAQGHTLILSSHILPFIREWCDPIIIMNRGRIIQTLSAVEIAKLEGEKAAAFDAIFLEMIESNNPY